MSETRIKEPGNTIDTFNKAVAIFNDEKRPPLERREQRQLVDHLGRLLVNIYRRAVDEKRTQDPVIQEIKTALTNALELREVTQNVGDDVKAILVKEERVHPMAGGIKELTENRLAPDEYALGGPSKAAGKFYNKHAYGVFLPWETVPSCVVYTAQSPSPWQSPEPSKDYGNQRLPGGISEFRDQRGVATERPRYVMFYSISNITKDLPGIRLGPILLGKLADRLKQELDPTKVTYSTLSPVRFFPQWLDQQLTAKGDNLFTDKEKTAVAEVFGADMTPSDLFRKYMPIRSFEKQEAGRPITIYEVANEPPFDHMQPQQKALFEMLRADLALEFLATARKDRSATRKQTAFDDVEDFHLGNGAYVGNIAIQPDAAEWRQAGGVMANYVYSAHMDRLKGNYEKGEGGSGLPQITLDKQLHNRLTKRHKDLPLEPAINDQKIASITEVHCATLAAHRAEQHTASR